jgi:hypothetical protein
MVASTIEIIKYIKIFEKSHARVTSKMNPIIKYKRDRFIINYFYGKIIKTRAFESSKALKKIFRKSRIF